MDDLPFLEIHRVSQWFDSHEVLRDVSLHVKRGETLAIIGESGCGKSVTLKLLIGLLSPTVGEVRLQGRSLETLSPRELARARLRFGFLFQGAALFDSLTVADNVAFGLRQNTRLLEGEIQNIVRDRLHEVGLPPSICGKKPAELSGGQRKRVGLARALALTPEIMLYDEPTTGLDPIMTDVINELILQTRAQRPVTSIIVTHEMTTVRKVAERVVMLGPVAHLRPEEPQIVFDNTPEAAFSSEDQRVHQFVHGQACERLRELAG
jgi:phospholipid/cholesterol/gamma-HCH transport system ATP-binding protein